MFKGHIDRLSERISKTPEDPELLQRFAAAAGLVHAMPFEVNLWKPQNTYYGMLTAILPEMQHRAASGDEKARHGTTSFSPWASNLAFT